MIAEMSARVDGRGVAAPAGLASTLAKWRDSELLDDTVVPWSSS